MPLEEAGKTSGVEAAPMGGVTAGQCTIVPLGSAWTRVETTAGKDEPKNRRVKI